MQEQTSWQRKALRNATRAMLEGMRAALRSSPQADTYRDAVLLTQPGTGTSSRADPGLGHSAVRVAVSQLCWQQAASPTPRPLVAAKWSTVGFLREEGVGCALTCRFPSFRGVNEPSLAVSVLPCDVTGLHRS